MELRGFEPQLLTAEIPFDLQVHSVSFRFSPARYLRIYSRVLTASRRQSPSHREHPACPSIGPQARNAPPQEAKRVNKSQSTDAYRIGEHAPGLEALASFVSGSATSPLSWCGQSDICPNRRPPQGPTCVNGTWIISAIRGRGCYGHDDDCAVEPVARSAAHGSP